MTEDQRAILDQHGVTSPADLPFMERLRFANAPSEAEVVAGTKAEAVTPSPFNLASDAGDNFDLDGARLRNTGLSPATRLGMKARFDMIAAERQRRAMSQPPQVSDDEYFTEMAALRHVANAYSDVVIGRILATAGRAWVESHKPGTSNW